MKRWLIVSLLALAMSGCAGVHTDGGPIGPTVQNKKPAHQASTQQPDSSQQQIGKPGQILVKPGPGQSLDDLQRRFGAENVSPYRPDGMDDSLALEFGLKDWYVIRVPEGKELEILGELADEGGYGDLKIMPVDPRWYM